MSERFIGPFTREMAQFIEDVSRCGPVTQNDLRKLWPDAEEARKAFETLLALYPQPPHKPTTWDFMPPVEDLQQLAWAMGLTLDEVRDLVTDMVRTNRWVPNGLLLRV